MIQRLDQQKNIKWKKTVGFHIKRIERRVIMKTNIILNGDALTQLKTLPKVFCKNQKTNEKSGKICNHPDLDDWWINSKILDFRRYGIYKIRGWWRHLNKMDDLKQLRKKTCSTKGCNDKVEGVFKNKVYCTKCYNRIKRGINITEDWLLKIGRWDMVLNNKVRINPHPLNQIK